MPVAADILSYLLIQLFYLSPSNISFYISFQQSHSLQIKSGASGTICFLCASHDYLRKHVRVLSNLFALNMSLAALCLIAFIYFALSLSYNSNIFFQTKFIIQYFLVHPFPTTILLITQIENYLMTVFSLIRYLHIR